MKIKERMGLNHPILQTHLLSRLHRNSVCTRVGLSSNNTPPNKCKSHNLQLNIGNVRGKHPNSWAGRTSSDSINNICRDWFNFQLHQPSVNSHSVVAPLISPETQGLLCYSVSVASLSHQQDPHRVHDGPHWCHPFSCPMMRHKLIW